ncbi:MAG: hypothetical protein K0R51_882 [Cytophagaceae bacterium]|jgi:hypothetical protein|nr:hypothetical protein [Cytophagaceae bacterium]
MNTNLDLSKIQAYSTALASKLSNGFFPGKEVINGEQLLSFTSVQQLNLFIVKTLFERWKDELQKLRSPYFNYEAQEVQEALNGFMNTLSKNIAISKESFHPLLQKAIADVVVISIAPTEYIQQEFNASPVALRSNLLDKFKYHKVHETIFKRFHEQLSSIPKTEVTQNEINVIISSLPISTPEEEAKAKELLDGLYALLQFDIKEFNPQTLKTSFQQEASRINIPFGEEIKQAATLESIAVQKKPAEKTVFQQKTGDQQLTINDSLKGSHESSIADRFSKSKIEDIKSSIPLNLKFLFINILFDGNSVDYNTALNEIEQEESIEKVKDLLNRNYSEKYKWANHTEEADEFLKIIERKFY